MSTVSNGPLFRATVDGRPPGTQKSRSHPCSRLALAAARILNSYPQTCEQFFSTGSRGRRRSRLGCCDRHGSKPGTVEPEPSRKEPSAGRARGPLPSSTLSASPSPSGPAAQSSPSAPPLQPVRQPRCPRACTADQRPGARASPRRTRAAFALALEARERRRHPLEREGERDDAAAVDRGRDAVRVQAARPRPRRGIVCCTGCSAAGSPRSRQPCARQSGEHAGVLAGAVVVEPRRRLPSAAALEVVLAVARAPWRAAPARRRAARGRRGARRRRSRGRARRGRRRARASGSAWNGFADERMNVTSAGSPADATICAVLHRDGVHAVRRPRRLRHGARLR